MSRTFEIETCLGRGGFGEVYRARMRRGDFETEVALKLLHADVDPHGQATERLRDEARLLGLVRHRAIPRVHDLVELEGRLVLVSEYVEGADLSRCLRAAAPPSVRACADVVASVADALHAAWHAPAGDGRTARIVHRDLKPANVRIARDGAVKLLDFGIAWTDEVTRAAHTQTEALIGSTHYMAPERFDGAAPDPAQDVYALGTVLFEALTRQKLFDDMAFRAIATIALFEDRHVTALEHRLRVLPPTLPAALVALIRAMLAWAPRERPTASEVARRIEAIAPSCPGDSLATWCRERSWPDEAGRDGPWVGRTLVERTSDDVAAQPAERTSPLPFDPPTSGLTGLDLRPVDDATATRLRPPPTSHAAPAWIAISAVVVVGMAVVFQAAGSSRQTGPLPVLASHAAVEPTIEPIAVATSSDRTAAAVPATTHDAPKPTPAPPSVTSPQIVASAQRTASEPVPAVRARVKPVASETSDVPHRADVPRVDEALAAIPAPVVARIAPTAAPTAAPAPVAPKVAPKVAPATPIAPVGLRVVLDPRSESVAAILVGDAGRFRLPATVPPGRYTVLVEDMPGHETVWGTKLVGGAGPVRVQCGMKRCM